MKIFAVIPRAAAEEKVLTRFDVAGAVRENVVTVAGRFVRTEQLGATMCVSPPFMGIGLGIVVIAAGVPSSAAAVKKVEALVLGVGLANRRTTRLVFLKRRREGYTRRSITGSISSSSSSPCQALLHLHRRAVVGKSARVPTGALAVEVVQALSRRVVTRGPVSHECPIVLAFAVIVVNTPGR